MAKGNIEDSVPKIASAFADFIEEQKDKDLLEVRLSFFLANRTVERSRAVYTDYCFESDATSASTGRPCSAL